MSKKKHNMNIYQLEGREMQPAVDIQQMAILDLQLGVCYI